MKVKVTKRFRDKHTGSLHEVNEIIEVSNGRYEEITAHGDFVEKTGLETLTKKELLELAKDLDVNQRMTKAEIISALEV